MFRTKIVVTVCLASALLCLSASGEDAKLHGQIKNEKKHSTLVIKAKVKRANIATELGKLLPKVGDYLKAKNVQPLSAPMTRYETSEGETFEIEAGFIVPDGTKGEGEIVAGELPAGRVAMAIHTGSYEGLPKTYEAIIASLAAKGETTSNTSWEVYISDPGSTKPQELKTEIYLLLEPRK